MLSADKDKDEDDEYGNDDGNDDDARDVRPLLEEMCCQRIAQDFQLVERVTQDGSAPGTATQVTLHEQCPLFVLLSSCTRTLICGTILLQLIVPPVPRTVLTDPGQGNELCVSMAQ